MVRYVFAVHVRIAAATRRRTIVGVDRAGKIVIVRDDLAVVSEK